MKNTIIFLSVLFFIYYQACTNDPSEKEIEYILPPTFEFTDKIRYTVEGGGDIDFIVENNPDSISIIVLRFQFHDRNDSLMISKLDIDSSDLVILEAVFRGTINIGGIIYRNDLLTGTWTYMYIEYNKNWLRVANEAIIDELKSLYNLVCSKINVNLNT
jgi:hypothetical protein